MHTGPLKSNPFEAFTKALRSHLPTKEPAPSAPSAAPSGLAQDRSAVAPQDERYRAFENAKPLDLSSYAPAPTPSWISGKQLNNILSTIKRHLGGTIPPGTVITIRPRPGGNPGSFTVTVDLRRVRDAVKPQGRIGAPPTTPPTGGLQTPPVSPRTPEPPKTEAPKSDAPAEIKKLLSGPLPELPGPATGSTFKEIDTQNRSALIENIRKDPALQSAFDNWSALPESTRLQAGQRISQMMGEIYGFDPSPITLNERLRGTGTLGLHRTPPGLVELSPDILRDPSQFVDTVTHEQAHAYQHQKVDALDAGKLSADDPIGKQAKEWAANFERYIPPSQSITGYKNQPVERHAHATGQQIAAGIFS